MTTYNLDDADRLLTLGMLFPEAAHEIRNLMQSVYGLAKLEAQHATDPKSSARLLKISQNALLAGELTSTLLRLSQSAKPDPSGNVNDGLEAVLNLYRHLRAKDVRLLCSIHSQLPAVSLPTAYVELILLNLLKNSFEAVAASENRAIRVAAEKRGHEVAIDIWNSGPALDADVLARMFREQITTKSKDGGSGLGLRVVHRLVTEAGGRVSARNVDDGVLFSVLLPALGAEQKVSFTPVSSSASQRQLRGRRILVVDDDASVRDALQLMICELGGGRVQMCASGEEASALPCDDYDAILLDLRMRGMSGQDLFERLPTAARHKVVFVTGDAMSSASRQFIAGCGRPVLLKPVSFSRLCEAVCGLAG